MFPPSADNVISPLESNVTAPETNDVMPENAVICVSVSLPSSDVL